MKSTLLISFVLFSTICFAQTIEQKVDYLVNSIGQVNAYQSIYKYNKIERAIRNVVSREDSLKLVEIKNSITYEDANKRISKSFTDFFTPDEIETLYQFYTSSAGKKLISNYGAFEKIIQKNFQDIDDKIDALSNKNLPVEAPQYKEDGIAVNINDSTYQEPNNKSFIDYKNISVDKPDGIYAITNNDESSIPILEKEASINKDDMASAKTVFDRNLNETNIHIILTEKGRHKLAVFTENNIGKQIAIVFNNKIIISPIVKDKINLGQMVIAGNPDLNDNEIKQIINSINNK